jgi:hypothetical protein
VISDRHVIPAIRLLLIEILCPYRVLLVSEESSKSLTHSQDIIFTVEPLRRGSREIGIGAAEEKSRTMH